MVKTESQPTVRLSLGGVLLLGAAVFGVGLAGGLLANYILAPTLAPLPGGEDRLITTVQEITVSPNKATAEVVRERERAVVLIGEAVGDSFEAAGPGTVVTNDGLVVSMFNIGGESLAAFDSDGRKLALHKVGSDPVYGLTYYQLPESVIQPFGLADTAADPGTTLLALSRREETSGVSASAWQVMDYILPPAGQAPGRQRLFESASVLPDRFSGSPLINEDGSLAGMIVDAPEGVAITSTDIRASLNRATTGRRELNPFTDLGFQAVYGFAYDADSSRRVFGPTVASVAGLSAAAVADLRAGDVITSVNGTEILWETNLVEALGAPGAVTLGVVRRGAALTLILNP